MAKTSGASNLFPLIRYSDFVVGEEIGETGAPGRPSGPSGRFKRVCKGTFKYVEDDSQRDIVVLRYGRNGDVEKQREVEILAMLARDPDARKFVPQIFGACEERPERLVLQERAYLGSLKTALAEGSELRQAFTPPHRLHAAFQVSRAMVFLESLRIVHCDLSCRNCLLFYLDEEDDAGVLVKITDMGLAFVLPDGVSEVTKKQPQAVRWCAPETVGRAVLSHQADAWSVGMTIWELWSGGCNPWPFRERRPEVSAILRGLGAGGTADAANEFLDAVPLAANKEVPRPFISMQDEMPVPDCEPHGISCPKPVHEVICGATIVDPKRRKGLRQLLKDLADIIRSLQQPPERPQDTNSPGQHSASVPTGPPKPRRLVAHNAALSCKESVERITSNNDVCHFYEWALTRWDQIFDLFLQNTRDPSGQAIVDSGPRDQRGLTKQQWVENITDMGFKGDAGVVFEELMLENVGVDAVRQAKAMAMGASIVPTATLPQVKRFAARIAAASSSLKAGDGASPAAAFARHLKSIRGTVLKAWRQDIDLRKAGRVAYADFTNACRKLGLSSQGRLIWDCLRKEARTAPLEFHEVAPEEADNMEGFCEILLTTYGFDLEKAWRDLDPNNQQYLSLPDFVAAARALGFEGNPKLIFKGLDGGLGRLLPENFEYLAKISNKAPYGRSQSRGPMADLITFVRRESPDVTTFLNKLGITTTQGEIAVNDLAARLTAVGFEGDALQASLKAARSSGGSRVSVEMLRLLLSGDRIRDTDSEAPSAVLWGTARLPGPKQRPFRPMQAWNDSIDNFSEQNLSRCHSSRQYFGGTSTSPIHLNPQVRQH